MSITSNAAKLATAWEKRANALEPAMRKATAKATQVLYAESRKLMTQEIYDKPEDRLPSGKKAWTRTGNLRRSEHQRVQTAYLGIIWNDAQSKDPKKKGRVYNYARKRHDLISRTRTAHWRADAIRNTRLKIQNIYRDALSKAVMAGQIPGLGGLK